MLSPHRTRELAKEYGRAALIGLVGGIVCLVFRWMVEAVQRGIGFGTNVVEGARSMHWLQLLLLPAAGMGIAWLIQRFLVPKDRGAAFADVMEAVSVKRGAVSLRSAVTRSLASLATISTGGSVGREGPIISLSAAATSKVTALLRAPAKERGLLIGCGVAAGFASAYNAPIAGAVFALEIVLGNFAMELFAPVVVASAVATLTTRYLPQLVMEPRHVTELLQRHGTTVEPVYDIRTKFTLESPLEVVPYVILGVLAGFVSVGFQHSLRRTQAALARIPIPRWALMVLGGLTIGAIAIAFPEVCGNGYNAVDEILNREGPRLTGGVWWQLIAVLLSLMAVKTIGTAITVGSGGSGGVFTPSMFIGAALGGAFGVLVNRAAPHVTGNWGGYALVGMGCLVAGTTRAPIMAVLVMFEMTLNYDIMVPLLLGGTTASLVARRIYPHSIYDEEFVARGKTAPQGIEETVLVTTRVDDVMRQTMAAVDRSTPYTDIIPLLSQSRTGTVFVKGEGGKYLGAIRIQEVVELASMGDLGPGIIAMDIMGAVPAVRPADTLSRAFDLYENNEVDELPVVDDAGILVGGIARRDVMSVLQVEVLKRQNLRAKFVRRDDDDGTHTDYVELPKGAQLARVALRTDVAGKSLAEAGVRAAWRLTILAVVRRDAEGRELRLLPESATRLERGDDLIVLGAQEDIDRWREGTPSP